MKKRKQTIVTGILLISAVCVAALGFWKVPQMSRAAAEAQRMSEAQAAQPELVRVAQAVSAAEPETRRQTKEITRYANWVKVYHPTQEQQNEISQMIANGADVDILLDICIFWEDTNEPFSLVSQLYNNRPEDEILAEFTDNLLWITGLYDKLKGKENEALNREEVMEYVNQGLSLSDILVADRISRAGADIREVLADRTEGQSWQEIILPETANISAFGLEAEETEAFEIGGNDLLDSLILSRKTGIPAADFLQAAQEEDGMVMSAYETEQTKNTMDELLNIGLIELEEEVLS